MIRALFGRGGSKEIGTSPSGLVRIAVQAMLGGFAFMALAVLSGFSVIGQDHIAGAVFFAAVGLVLLALASRLGALARTSREVGVGFLGEASVLAVATGVDSDLLSGARIMAATNEGVALVRARLVRSPQVLGSLSYAAVQEYTASKLGLVIHGADLDLSVNRALPPQIEALVKSIEANSPARRGSPEQSPRWDGERWVLDQR